MMTYQNLYQINLDDPDWPERMEIIRAEDDEEACRIAETRYCTNGVYLLEIFELDEAYIPVRSVDW